MGTRHGSRHDGWRQPVAVPRDLNALRGPLSGVVRLPLRIYSSGLGPERTWNLADEDERVTFYKVVLTGGDADDICRYVNLGELRRLWPRLWLPPYVREAWEPLLSEAQTA